MSQINQRSLETDKLVIACRNNDRKAQISLYELYAKQMYNTSLRIVRDSMLAEDIVQESFLKAYKSLPGFRNEVPFVIWLKRIVINKSLDELRKNKHEVLSCDENTIPEIPDDKDEEINTEHNEKLIQS